MRNKLRAARSLSLEEWRIFWQAWFLLLAVDWGLRLLPFRTVQRWLRRGMVREDSGDPKKVEAEMQRTWRMVAIASRNHLYAMTCLRRSLALQRLLAQYGVQAELCFGVIKDGDRLNAHAWIEYDGKSFGKTSGGNQFHILIPVVANP